MVSDLKRVLYFPIAYYFRFFAKVKLLLWKPRIIVVTGSVGKTTLFELVKSQIGDKAYYSEHANSTYGIPWNILGLKSKNYTYFEQFTFLFMAPFKSFLDIPKQKIYVAEADCDRPKEGKFLATLLTPEVTLWLSTALTHSANFESFPSAEKAIAHEYGYFIENTSKLAIINNDLQLICDELKRTQAEVVKVTKKDLAEYKISETGTKYTISDTSYSFNALLPEAFYSSIDACKKLVEYLGFDFDSRFSNFQLPPGRSTIINGIKNTTIIDSSYNASKASIVEYLNALKKLKQQTKKPASFLFGDMRELGKESEDEHKEIAKLASEFVDQLYCVGEQTLKYVVPNIVGIPVHQFKDAREAGKYIADDIKPESLILVKGSQNEIYLEESIKFLLENKSDEKLLCRNNTYWKKIKEDYFAKVRS